jgi:TolB-like protein
MLSRWPQSVRRAACLGAQCGTAGNQRELLDLVWPETSVEEANLSVNVSALRKALGDDEGERRYIETVSRTGYRFVAPVKHLTEDESLPAQQSVAVLPARPFIGEMFSDRDRHTGLAIADALIDRLGRSRHILVRPTRAVRAYVNAPDDPAAIGRSLRVNAVIDTRFLATADRIKFSVHLLRSRDGTSLWTGSFDEAATEVITIADLVAECVAAQLGPESQESATPRSTMRPVAHPKVYEPCGRGRFHLLSYSMFEVPNAVRYF